MKKITQVQLIDELNSLYVDLTGEGISPFFEKTLMEGGVDTLLALIEEKKHILAHAIYREIEEDDDAIALDAYMSEQPERCDSIEHN